MREKEGHISYALKYSSVWNVRLTVIHSLSQKIIIVPRDILVFLFVYLVFPDSCCSFGV